MQAGMAGQGGEDLAQQYMVQPMDATTQIILSLQNLQQGQIQLQQTIDSSVKKLKEELETVIEEKLKTFKDSVKGDLDKMTADITALTVRVNEVESHTNQHHTKPDDQVAEKTVLVKGLEESPEETMDTIKVKFEEILQKIDVKKENIHIVHSERLNANVGGKPKHLKLVLGSKQERSTNMKNKRKLAKEDSSFKEVFIEPWLTKQELTLQANLRKIAKAVPQLSMKSGKLVTK